MDETVELKLNKIVKDLEKSIYESMIAVDDPEKGYPYAAGYARSALQMVLTDVKLLKTYLTDQTK
jgi:hypothetical protein